MGPISYGRGLEITVTLDDAAFEGAGVAAARRACSSASSRATSPSTRSRRRGCSPPRAATIKTWPVTPRAPTRRFDARSIDSAIAAAARLQPVRGVAAARAGVREQPRARRIAQGGGRCRAPRAGAASDVRAVATSPRSSRTKRARCRLEQYSLRRVRAERRAAAASHGARVRAPPAQGRRARSSTSSTCSSIG